jgi:hypothetical protein
MVDKEKVDEPSMSSQKRPKSDAWRDCNSHKIDDSNELNAKFNWLKIHMMSYWVNQICRYRVLQQYSAERHEQAHQMNIKDGWNTPTNNLNNLPKVIRSQLSFLCLDIREINLQTLTECWENSAHACIVLRSGANLAAPLGSQSYAWPQFMGPNNRRDGNHPDAMIKESRALLDHSHNTTHRLAVYIGTWDLIQHK